MLKKRYIITALGVVGILLGSLLVNNLILAQSSGEYDPWLDYNEDGVVDVKDLHSLSQKYSASGNPEKDVNVTNWPEPEWMSEPQYTFPQTLKLRGSSFPAINSEGIGYTAWELLDEDDTIPKRYNQFHQVSSGNTPDWTLGFNNTFVHQKYPQHSYNINGSIRANLYFAFWPTGGGTGYLRGNLTLLKILPNNTRVLLAVMWSFDLVATPYWKVENMALIVPILTPIAINENERIGVSFLYEYKWISSNTAIISFYYNPDTDDFLINLPIAP